MSRRENFERFDGSILLALCGALACYAVLGAILINAMSGLALPH